MTRFLLPVLLAFFLVACANHKVQDLYDGADEHAALIQSDDTVLIKYIDNTPVADGFIGQKIRYQVGAGQHTLIAEYSDIFDISDDDFDKVVSRPAKITFNAEPGKEYFIGNQPQKTLQEAKDFAENPEFLVTEIGSNKAIEAKVELSRPRTFMTTLRSAAAPVYEFESDQVNTSATRNVATGAADSAVAIAPEQEIPQSRDIPAAQVLPENIPSPLLILQQVWDRASEAEREEFLRWVNLRKQ
ncbi:DUF2057 domain-containing protein [Ketobacter sp. MCCC 1A13808]|uniref:DUF2057 family protein n=1 Tax=Ketobacter sp. MCCC 1A13808 TaxID=2602738 RepID=UPI000F171D5E|nr:DUF2057 family protein [Ketobacter sp. MCCC 1A13808]MVF12748.1 DUF2057 domain-containing protein [Ketobacter sp. MCCC 1A13808]RLP54009.1 MAG: DUF2057 domain-containing protein [Ketobacter sp.]